ncbi:MAG: hypothetical protein IT438_10170 [Phycisphaerales bacterium]|nr:hypothetical protein [Phycisphaerales bacterium]
MGKRSGLVGLGVFVGIASLAQAAPPVVEVIYSRAPLGSTSDVPGAVDLTGTAVATKFNSMLELWTSPDGSRFLLRGATTQPTAESDNYLLLGSGNAGSVFQQEGRPFPGAVGAEVVDFFSSLNPQPFNGANDFVFPVRSRGGVASVFQKIIQFNPGGGGTLRYQMGDPYVDLVDSPTTASGDETIGNSVASAHLLNDNRIGWQDNAVGNLSSTRRPVTAYNAVKFLQSRLDTVTPISGTGTILLTNIASAGTVSVFITSIDGSRVVVRGAVDVDGNGSNIPADPEVVIVDGQVRVQAGQVLPGDTVTVSAVHQTFVAPNNDWYVRGTHSAGASAFVARNGAIIAQSGGAITGDTWGAAMFSVAGNSGGDWVIAGKSAATVATDDVVVSNGRVLLREGDPVSIDLTGDGVPETAFIGRSNNTLGAFVGGSGIGITPNGTVYTIAYLRDSAGVDVAPTGSTTGYALIRIVPTGACCAGDGACTITTASACVGTYRGNESVCEPTACVVVVTGACCCGANCAITASAACTGPGTAFIPGGACAPYSATVPCCRGDYNKSGAPPTVQDIFDFLAAYFGNDECADANDSGGISVQDIFDFLAAYFGGC